MLLMLLGLNLDEQILVTLVRGLGYAIAATLAIIGAGVLAAHVRLALWRRQQRRSR